MWSTNCRFGVGEWEGSFGSFALGCFALQVFVDGLFAVGYANSIGFYEPCAIPCEIEWSGEDRCIFVFRVDASELCGCYAG
jgi:hypothetical protein